MNEFNDLSQTRLVEDVVWISTIVIEIPYLPYHISKYKLWEIVMYNVKWMLRN